MIVQALEREGTVTVAFDPSVPVNTRTAERASSSVSDTAPPVSDFVVAAAIAFSTF